MVGNESETGPARDAAAPRAKRRRRWLRPGIVAIALFALLAGGLGILSLSSKIEKMFGTAQEELAGHAPAAPRPNGPEPEALPPITPKPEPEIVAPVPPAPSIEPSPHDPESGEDMVPSPSPPPPSETAKPGVTVSGWNTLLSGTKEAVGYGLYSYLLIPVNDEASRSRYLAALEALRRQIDPVAMVEGAGFKRYEINVTYLPVRRALAEDANAKRLLDSYDFARSKRILSYVGKDFGAGPYLVSYLEPLSAQPAPGSNLLVQDLGWVPAELVSLWVANFAEEVKNPRAWDRTSLTEIMLVSRTFLAVAGESFEIGAQAAERFVSLKKALAGQ